MPKVRIDIVKGTRNETQKAELLEVVHNALVQAIGIPEADRFQILMEHELQNFYIPFNGSNFYVNIDIVMYPGRADSAKKHLFNLIKEELVSRGYIRDEIMITLHDPPLSNWG